MIVVAVTTVAEDCSRPVDEYEDVLVGTLTIFQHSFHTSQLMASKPAHDG